ncbi:hypothetical protein [Hyphomonas sp.]|uniref:hypothetical protein n=1 Tax=Hyphomonas sp. TaxID=87 RepID=UPI0035657B77
MVVVAQQSGARFGLIDPCGYYSIDYPNSLSKEYASADLRKVLESDIELLHKPELTSAERHAVREHKKLAYKQWAWRHLIEMVRDRNALGVARTLIAPPDVFGALLLRLCRHALGREPVPDLVENTAKTQSIDAMLKASNGSLLV